MVLPGQVWFTGQRSIEVLNTDGGAVTLRDAYGRRRTLTELNFTEGFVATRGERPASSVMACRALADLEPS